MANLVMTGIKLLRPALMDNWGAQFVIQPAKLKLVSPVDVVMVKPIRMQVKAATMVIKPPRLAHTVLKVVKYATLPATEFPAGRPFAAMHSSTPIIMKPAMTVINSLNSALMDDKAAQSAMPIVYKSPGRPRFVAIASWIKVKARAVTTVINRQRPARTVLWAVIFVMPSVDFGKVRHRTVAMAL